MTDARLRAQEVLSLIEEGEATFYELPDAPGQRVHCLFLGLYRQTTKHWLRALDEVDAPLFAYLVIRRFYEIYETSVPGHLAAHDTAPPRPWRMYHWLAARLTMRSPISMHLMLLAFGVRAHVRHDLGVAIANAARDHRRMTGMPVEFDTARETIVGPVSAQAFFAAALDLSAWHKARERGWRYLALTVHGLTLRALRPLWVGVLEGWRLRAWNEALQDEIAVSEPSPGQLGED